jgi:hypothetical protein
MHNNNLQEYPRKLMCKDLEGAGPNSFKTMSRHFPGKTQGTSPKFGQLFAVGSTRPNGVPHENKNTVLLAPDYFVYF